ncbi:MAG: LysR family transcriptional regulator [Labilithrix sp.]|nr:LysR family transcriptional regulator [Labilithrix sp.]
MDRLDTMRLFVRVVETGSFSKAANVEGVVQSTASKQIAALERRLGTQLLRRTSQGLSTTEQGQAYYESVVKLFADFDEAEAAVRHGQHSPAGALRVAVPSAFGRLYVVPHLGRLMAQYPGLSVELEVGDRYTNLVEEGIDVAIRIGQLGDSSLVARRIASFTVATVASARYLANHGEPRRPRDLGAHACITFMFKGRPRGWDFREGGRVLTITPNGPLRFNDAESVRAAVLSDLGIGHAPRWLFADAMEDGTVKSILAAHAPTKVPVHAVTAGGRMPSKARAFVDFIAETLETSSAFKA